MKATDKEKKVWESRQQAISITYRKNLGDQKELRNNSEMTRARNQETFDKLIGEAHAKEADMNLWLDRQTSVNKSISKRLTELKKEHAKALMVWTSESKNKDKNMKTYTDEMEEQIRKLRVSELTNASSHEETKRIIGEATCKDIYIGRLEYTVKLLKEKLKKFGVDLPTFLQNEVEYQNEALERTISTVDLSRKARTKAVSSIHATLAQNTGKDEGSKVSRRYA